MSQKLESTQDSWSQPVPSLGAELSDGPDPVLGAKVSQRSQKMVCAPWEADLVGLIIRVH